MSEKKTIIVAGYGPGISNALAERFGQAGFRVALVARNARRLDKGVEALSEKGIEARAFPADLADEDAAREVVKKVRERLGPVDAIAWVAYANTAGDVIAAPPSELRGALELATTSLVAAVQEALPDLRARKGAVLVTNGGFGLFDEGIDAMVARGGAMGLAISNSAKHKLVGLLAQRLRPDGVYVGEVMVLGLVRGTAFDTGGASLEPSAVAEKFWKLYTERSETFTQIG